MSSFSNLFINKNPEEDEKIKDPITPSSSSPSSNLRDVALANLKGTKDDDDSCQNGSSQIVKSRRRRRRRTLPQVRFQLTGIVSHPTLKTHPVMKRRRKTKYVKSIQYPSSSAEFDTRNPEQQENTDLPTMQEPNMNINSSNTGTTTTTTSISTSSYRLHKKPSLNYSVPGSTQFRPPRSRRIEELVEEFDMERYSANLKYNAMSCNIRSFIEGEKDNLAMLKTLKSNFKHNPGFKSLDMRYIRCLSSRISEQSEMVLSTLRNTVKRYSDIREHEAEMEYICATHKDKATEAATSSGKDNVLASTHT